MDSIRPGNSGRTRVVGTCVNATPISCGTCIPGGVARRDERELGSGIREVVLTNRVPIMMQDVYERPGVDAVPFETVITRFPRGYMANRGCNGGARLPQEGVTHLTLFGCDYSTGSGIQPPAGVANTGSGSRKARMPCCCRRSPDLLDSRRLLSATNRTRKGCAIPRTCLPLGPLKATGKKPPADGLTLTPADHPENARHCGTLAIAPDPGAFDTPIWNRMEYLS